MPKLFNYCELVQKDEFSKLTRDRLEEELSIITGMIEAIPPVDIPNTTFPAYKGMRLFPQSLLLG